MLHRLFSNCREWGLLSSCSKHASSCSGFSCCRAWTIGCVDSEFVVGRLLSTGITVVAYGFSCSEACGICLDQGLKPCLLHWQVDSDPLSHQDSPVQFSHSVLSDSLQPHGVQHTRLPCPSPTTRVSSNSCPLNADAIQPSHPLLSPSPLAFNLFQHQSLFK